MLFFIVIACIKEPPQKTKAENSEHIEMQSELSARGRGVYLSNCIACHSQDPKKNGSLGPALYGSSKELIEARVLRGEYPPGYKPKRNTHVMVALPHLKNDIEAIHAYLNL